MEGLGDCSRPVGVVGREGWGIHREGEGVMVRTGFLGISLRRSTWLSIASGRNRCLMRRFLCGWKHLVQGKMGWMEKMERMLSVTSMGIRVSLETLERMPLAFREYYDGVK